MKQVHKAEAEQLRQSRFAESSHAGSKASARSATHSPLSAAPKLIDESVAAGNVHMCDDDNDNDDKCRKECKRHQAASGAAGSIHMHDNKDDDDNNECHKERFGSNQVPIPIFSELEPKAAVEAPTVAAVEAPTVAAATAPTVMAASALASVTSATTAPSLFAITKTPEPAEPDSVSKSETEEMAADTTDYLSKVATAPTMLTMLMMPMFSPASVSAASNALLVKVLDIVHHMSMAPSGIFSIQLVTSAMTNATGTAMGTAMPELVPKAVTSVPTFLFGLSKPAADLASKPVVTSGLFSFGAAAATLNVTTTSAVVAGDKPKSEFKFSFGSLGATLTAGTQATLAAASQSAQQMTFGQICAGAGAASHKAPTILTAKQPHDNEASSSDMPAASKPKFSFGLSSATGSGFSLASLASSALVFGSQSFNFTTNPAFTSLTVNSTMPASSKPVGTFTFGSTATSATTPSGAGGGAEFTFTFGCGSMPHTQPVLMATTCSPSNAIGFTSVATSFGGATNNALATSTSIFNFGSLFGGLSAAKPTATPALTAFGGFGKGTMTLVPGTTANMPVFLFGSTALGMPAVSPFLSMSIAMPTATTYANPAASATTTPACGAATPLASGFGSGPVVWPTITPFANPATLATTPACGPATLSAPHFSFGPITLLTTTNIANLPVFFCKPAAATPKPLKSILHSNAPSFKPKKAVCFVSCNPQADAGVGCSRHVICPNLMELIYKRPGDLLVSRVAKQANTPGKLPDIGKAVLAADDDHMESINSLPPSHNVRVDPGTVSARDPYSLANRPIAACWRPCQSNGKLPETN
ncbi:hypothetical protein IWW38_002320 [Coemansia aciculifera]|uniref:Uncharacterized protein n=1 Tax=Coemansia aciculifera TaxID=417176 RepID=A0ACC1M5F1_9FUNG|nr:hypothetical protein IWW38_002320 [Coemansia aciculifera]